MSMFAPAHGWLSATMARFALHDYSNKQLLSIINNRQAFDEMATVTQKAVQLCHSLQNEWVKDEDTMEGHNIAPSS